MSFSEILSSDDTEIRRLKGKIETRYRYMLPRGVTTFEDYSAVVDNAVKKEQKLRMI
jgi:hypothetical protein